MTFRKLLTFTLLIGAAPVAQGADRVRKADGAANQVRYVITDSTPVWNAAGDFTKPGKGKLPFGTKVEVVATKAGWLRISDPSSKTKGWIPGFLATSRKEDIDLLQRTDKAPTAVIAVVRSATSSVQGKRLHVDYDSFAVMNLLYSGPAFKSDLPFALTNGERIEVEGVGWRNIRIAEPPSSSHMRLVLDLAPGQAVFFKNGRGLEDATVIVTGTADGPTVNRPKEWQLYYLNHNGVLEVIP